LHSVREWCELAFAYFGLDSRQYVVSDPQFWRPAEVVPLVGDPKKAKEELGWSASTTFPALVTIMLEAELAGR
jgi:GDPmannose 4,6-dehydratase